MKAVKKDSKGKTLEEWREGLDGKFIDCRTVRRHSFNIPLIVQERQPDYWWPGVYYYVERKCSGCGSIEVVKYTHEGIRIEGGRTIRYPEGYLLPRGEGRMDDKTMGQLVLFRLTRDARAIKTGARR